jgi:AhpD family alkylhydroperoxidase
MSTVENLSQKEKGLIAVAASIASGCMPCTEQNIKSVGEAGADQAEIREAIDTALGARNNATNIMAEAAQGIPTTEYPIKARSGSLEQPINELVWLGAALAADSVTGLEYYLTRARAAGASTRQIRTAIGIARAIRREAAEKADAIVGSHIEPTLAEGAGTPCGCG